MTSSRKRALAIVGGLGLSFAYLLQLTSPLRLWQDGIDHLVVAESVIEGHGFHRHWGSEPPGYPAVVVLLWALGLAHPAGFIALNLLCVAVALVAAFTICRDAFGFDPWTSVSIVLLTPLSWTVVKHSTLAAADVPYFGVSMAALAALGAMEQRRTLFRCLVATSLTVAAILIRTIGIALLPAVLWAVWCAKATRHHREHFSSPLRRYLSNGLVAGCVFVVLAVVVLSVLKTVYTSQIPKVYAPDPLHIVLTGLIINLRELGELVVNVPVSKVPAMIRLAYPFLGAVPLAALLYGLWLRRGCLRAVDVYLGAYLVIRCVWPYYDARFWVPVLPIAIGWVVTAVRRLSQRWLLRQVMQGYVVAFSSLGVLALVYTTRISFSGDGFPKLYGDGTLRPAYEVAFGNADPSDLSPKNRNALRLLQRFGSRTLPESH